MAVLVATVLAHPPVSNPPQLARVDEYESEDLNALHPHEQPLHTTVLMAHHSHTTPTAAREVNNELRWGDMKVAMMILVRRRRWEGVENHQHILTRRINRRGRQSWEWRWEIDSRAPHEEREAEHRHRADEDRNAYERHHTIFLTMWFPIETEQSQLIETDREGKDVYTEPPPLR